MTEEIKRYIPEKWAALSLELKAYLKSKFSPSSLRTLERIRGQEYVRKRIVDEIKDYEEKRAKDRIAMEIFGLPYKELEAWQQGIVDLKEKPSYLKEEGWVYAKVGATDKADSSQRNKGIVVCLCLAIGIGGFLLLSRRQKTSGKPLLLQQPGEIPKENSTPAHIKISALTSEDAKQMASKGMLHYKNKETRDISWNEDGLPTRITIEREYYQLP